MTITGDGTEVEVLTRAGANRAGIFIAVTGCDDQNLTACQLAKHRFGSSRTMALVNLPNHRRLFELARGRRRDRRDWPSLGQGGRMN